MTFSCDKNLILEAVNNAIRTVPSKSSLPVLEGLLLHVCDDGSLRIIGSDAEMFIETIKKQAIVNSNVVFTFYNETDDGSDEKLSKLPNIKKGDKFSLVEKKPEQKWTKRRGAMSSFGDSLLFLA